MPGQSNRFDNFDMVFEVFVEKTGGELGEHGIDSALIEEFGSESDKTDYELWLAQNRNHQ